MTTFTGTLSSSDAFCRISLASINGALNPASAARAASWKPLDLGWASWKTGLLYQGGYYSEMHRNAMESNHEEM